MKRRIILSLAFVMCLAGSTAAGEGRKSSDQKALARKNFMAALHCDHDGVRNSAIFQVLRYQERYPGDDLSGFAKRLREMSWRDTSPKNRLYALLACTAMQDIGLRNAAGELPDSEEGKDEWFSRLHQVIQNEFAVAQR